MIFDIIFANRSTGLLLFHRKLGSHITSSQVKPTFICSLMTAVSILSKAAVKQSIHYMELNTIALSLKSSEDVTVILIHDVVDGRTFGSVVCKALLRLYFSHLRNLNASNQSLNSPTVFLLFTKHLQTYLKTTVLLLLESLLDIKYIVAAYIHVDNKNLKPIMGTHFLFPNYQRERLSTRATLANNNFAVAVPGKVANLIHKATELCEHLRDTGMRVGNSIERIELLMSASHRLDLYQLCSSTYLIIVLGRRVKRAPLLRPDVARPVDVSYPTIDGSATDSNGNRTCKSDTEQVAQSCAKWDANSEEISTTRWCISRVFDVLINLR